MEEASLSRIEKEVSLIILAERARSVCVYFVMTRLGEPADLTVKNGENPPPPPPPFLAGSRRPNPAALG